MAFIEIWKMSRKVDGFAISFEGAASLTVGFNSTLRQQDLNKDDMFALLKSPVVVKGSCKRLEGDFFISIDLDTIGRYLPVSDFSRQTGIPQPHAALVTLVKFLHK
ncbi:hypothetical protein MMC07_008434 [Pseudocyphellaria aurata]|nr:hypothetical protein [Pseudocyphellaria aurata]